MIQLYNSWLDFNWHRASHSPSAIVELLVWIYMIIHLPRITTDFDVVSLVCEPDCTSASMLPLITKRNVQYTTIQYTHSIQHNA